MKPLGIVGLLLIIAGVVVLAMEGISYTKNREEVQVGPIEVAAEERGTIPPAAGIVAVAAGVVLLLVGRKRGT
ncbi:MAG TPA: hypothetical protein VJ596_07740 [Gemmatimonadaceae bacterium]|nr:hypothetical protein [Gemmatimonadaceae bacterium]